VLEQQLVHRAAELGRLAPAVVSHAHRPMSQECAAASWTLSPAPETRLEKWPNGGSFLHGPCWTRTTEVL
jgi:hypothetical protein